MQKQQVIVLRIERQANVSRNVIKKEDLTVDLLHKILNSYPTYPVEIFLSDQQVAYHAVDLAGLRSWNFAAVIQQAIECEFANTSWVQKQLAKCHKQNGGHKQRCILVGIDPSPLAIAVVKIVGQCSNPVKGVYLTSLKLAERIFPLIVPGDVKELDQDVDPESDSDWIIILTNNSDLDWELIVCHQQMVILQRNIIGEKHKVIDREILSTIQYLRRVGYNMGDTIIIIDHYNNFIGANCGDFDFADYPWIKIKTLKHDLSVENYKPHLDRLSYRQSLALVPSGPNYTLLSHCLAFVLPRYILKISLILISLLTFLSLVMLFFVYSDQSKVSSLLEDKIKYGISDQGRKSLETLNLFDHYQQLSGINITNLLKTVGKIFAAYGVVTSQRWRQEKTKDDILIKLDIDLDLGQTSIIQYKSKSFLKTPHKNNAPCLENIQQSIEQDLKDANLGSNMIITGSYPLLVFSLSIKPPANLSANLFTLDGF